MLLIGNSTFPKYSGIEAIPNVLTNLDLLCKSLLDPEIVGIPKANIKVLRNKNRQSIVNELYSITEKVRERKDTLIIYYSGHGMYDAVEFHLYLTANNSERDNLLATGIDIELFRKLISRCRAGHKIVILDCCHSGAFMGTMSDMQSKILNDINEFTGTYVMTSSSKNEPSIFPVDTPKKPTYFTGKLVEIMHEGLNIESEYCSFRDIFMKIKEELIRLRLPSPQQSNYNEADQLLFSKNKKYVVSGHPIKDEQNIKNEVIEELQLFIWAVKQKTVQAYQEYLKKFPDGANAEDARLFMQMLDSEQRSAEKRESKGEAELWDKVLKEETIPSFQEYLKKFPHGKHSEVAKLSTQLLSNEEKNPLHLVPPKRVTFPRQQATSFSNIPRAPVRPGSLSQFSRPSIRSFLREETAEQKEESKVYNEARYQNNELAYKAYLEKYPKGRYAYAVQRSIDRLNFTFYKDKVWWLILALIVTLSITGSILGYKAFLLLYYKALGYESQLKLSWLVLTITGFAWGLFYTFVDIDDATNREECLVTFFKPYLLIFSPKEGFGDILRGLFYALFINTLLILAIISLCQFLVHYLNWSLNQTVVSIMFIFFHFLAVVLFIDEA